MTKPRWIRAAMIALVIVSITGSLAMARDRGGKLTYSSLEMIHSYEPVMSNNIASIRSSSLIFEALVSKDPYGVGVVPRLARDMDVAPDMITFYLKPGVKWHDGQPFTSDDVAFSYDLIVDPRTKSSLGANFDFIRTRTIIDPLTISFTFKYPVYHPEWKFTALKLLPAHLFSTIEPAITAVSGKPNSRHSIRYSRIAMYSQPDTRSRVIYTMPFRCQVQVLEVKGNWVKSRVVGKGRVGTEGWIPKYRTFLTRRDRFIVNPVGTGPFTFKSVNYSGDAILERFEDYHGNKPYLDFVIRHHTTDKQTLMNNINVGNIDLIPETPLDQVSALSPKKVRKVEYSSLSFAGLLINCRHPLLKDARVRRAMALGFDRETQLRVFYANKGRLLAGPFSYDSWGVNLDLSPMPYDPEQARALLQEAGGVPAGARPLRLAVKTDENSVVYDICLAFIDAMGKLGIPVTLNRSERQLWQESLEAGDFDIAYVEWAFDLGYQIHGLFHSRGWLNYGKYSNEKVDALLDQMRVETDNAAMIQSANLIQEELFQDAPYVFLWTLDNIAAVSHRIKGVESDTISPFGFFDYIDKWWIPVELQ
jgi:ABC-type transport system substrate-binding protein